MPVRTSPRVLAVAPTRALMARSVAAAIQKRRTAPSSPRRKADATRWPGDPFRARRHLLPRRRGRQDRARLCAHRSIQPRHLGGRTSGRAVPRHRAATVVKRSMGGVGHQAWSRRRGHAGQIALPAEPWSPLGGRSPVISLRQPSLSPAVSASARKRQSSEVVVAVTPTNEAAPVVRKPDRTRPAGS
jgi:hypothetical protein